MNSFISAALNSLFAFIAHGIPNKQLTKAAVILEIAKLKYGHRHNNFRLSYFTKNNDSITNISRYHYYVIKPNYLLVYLIFKLLCILEFMPRFPFKHLEVLKWMFLVLLKSTSKFFTYSARQKNNLS